MGVVKGIDQGISIYNYSTWIAWAINPTSIGMIGAQAFVAHPSSDGRLIAYTSSITSRESILEKGKLSFPVYGVSAIYANNSITIFATLMLNSSAFAVNHVWQRGSMSMDNVPSFHGYSKDNLRSYGTLSFLSGKTGTRGPERFMVMKKIHGGLNVIGWGIMLPLGVVIARKTKILETTDGASPFNS
uniref:AIR12 DOMON domain-containing protein n=1 Tax=Quercus lobata TaxID=97700 RepID=A0A7N2MAV5_QUELO